MTKKINLAFIVHDIFEEIGHTRASLEVIRKLPFEEIESLTLICFSCDNLEKLFPDFYHQVNVKFVPFPSLRPFIFKSIFFQIYTSLFKNLLLPDKSFVITVGVCSFIGDMVNVQFCHRQWEELYFKFVKGGFFKNLYKKILLSYLSLCEKIYYRKDGLKFVFLAKFVAHFLTTEHKLSEKEQIISYSSVNTNTFIPSSLSKEQKRDLLLEECPILNQLDLQRPIFMFAGAFERKGLDKVLKSLNDGDQLIVVGRPESSKEYIWPQEINIFHIPFTRNIKGYYDLADAFLFPTYYEPFGLVLLEAASMGLDIFVPDKKVGASEILQGIPGINLINQNDKHIDLSTVEVKKSNEKMKTYLERKKIFDHMSWDKTAKEWWSLINR
jgi:glycosyltransferase involved in cell wall biosynthesis